MITSRLAELIIKRRMMSTSLERLKALTNRLGKHYYEIEQDLRKFKMLAEMMPIGIFHADRKGGFTYVNPYFERVTGLKYGELLGEGWLNIIPKEDRNKFATFWKHCVTALRTFHLQARFMYSNDEIGWAVFVATPDKDGGYIGTMTEIPRSYTMDRREHGGR